jgi:hypothetical protein
MRTVIAIPFVCDHVDRILLAGLGAVIAGLVIPAVLHILKRRRNRQAT